MLRWVEVLMGQKTVAALVLGIVFGLLIGIPFRKNARRAAASDFMMETFYRGLFRPDRKTRFLWNFIFLGIVIPGYCLGGAALCGLELLRRAIVWLMS